MNRGGESNFDVFQSSWLKCFGLVGKTNFARFAVLDDDAGITIGESSSRVISRVQQRLAKCANGFANSNFVGDEFIPV